MAIGGGNIYHAQFGKFFFLLILSTVFQVISLSLGQLKTPNNRPIIGVLSQEITNPLVKNKYSNYTSYIAASYVKFLEGAGARVVPIRINLSDDYYENIVNSVNGVLFPGGGINLEDSGYGKAGILIYNLASSLNNDGDYFPLWGTCLGFELMSYIVGGKRALTVCSALNEALPLQFYDGYLESRLFRNAPDDIVHLLRNKPMTANFHKFCVTEKSFVSSGLNEQFKILALSNDFKNESFISAMEAKDFPFYGVQFHPEKNSYEWNTNLHGIPHSAEATRVGQYFGEFFVNEARKNGHSFSSPEVEAQSLIYNYQAFPTASVDSSFEQCYFFK
ncbi:gamma-glutamyl hydrolase-like isoform X1 [Hetaerina americana]|uniref:gamma-glutamyl hydrolase-like isoform X1 n=1 Tax=Hetaerina americana TaxID=62018 RepID=UPI003A7F55AE